MEIYQYPLFIIKHTKTFEWPLNLNGEQNYLADMLKCWFLGMPPKFPFSRSGVWGESQADLVGNQKVEKALAW